MRPDYEDPYGILALMSRPSLVQCSQIKCAIRQTLDRLQSLKQWALLLINACCGFIALVST